MKKILSKINIQRIIIALCIMIVCINSQQMQVVKWDTGIYDFAIESMYALLAIIMLTNFPKKDFVKYKLPYIVWSIIGGSYCGIKAYLEIPQIDSYLIASKIVGLLGIFLVGYCIIHTIIDFFVEKKRPTFSLPILITWMIMLLLMIFSASGESWPRAYFVFFLCYYCIDQTKCQRMNTVKGIIDGIILGFCVIQGVSLLTRPYDLVRYLGNFSNPNHNCMFLCMCMAAILAKLVFLIKEKAAWYIRAFFYLMLGSCYSFVFMTICRSGYLVTAVLTICFLIAVCAIHRKMLFLRTGILLVAIFIVMLPTTYMAVRYIPTIHPHVVFHFWDPYSEDRVHSWDPKDSEKFVSFEELLETAVGRFAVLINAAELEETDPDMIPLLQEGDDFGAVNVRYTIYKWYWEHLTLRGIPYEEQGFKLTSDHWIQDTHNIYLYYGIFFGWPVMALFAIFIWWGIGKLLRLGWKYEDPAKFAALFLVIVPPVFGLFEYSWGTGMISTVAFYLMFKEMFVKNKKEQDGISQSKKTE